MATNPVNILKISKDKLHPGTLVSKMGIWFWLIIFAVIFSLISPYFF